VIGGIYRRLPSLYMARRNLSRTKVRSVLAALGIVIGVIAIASLGMFGLTLRYQITESLGDLGNQVLVTPGDDADGTISERDLRQIEAVAGPETTVVPSKARGTVVTYGRRGGGGGGSGEPSAGGQRQVVRGIENPGLIYEAREGGIPDPYRSGALIGPSIAEQYDLGPGDAISINGSSTRVVAVLEAGNGFGFMSPSNEIILPNREFQQRGYSQVLVSTPSSTVANETAVALRSELNGRRELVQVQDFSNVADSIGQTFQALNLFLIGIGSISLLVAGVSILNVMLMSTVERREEIGVLRAVGFQKRDVLKIMLSEAVLLGIVGGVAGAVFSLAAGMVINHFIVGDALLAFRPSNFLYVGLAFAFGVGTSLLSGLYPAWKAANERPVEALRS
jgi:putative ABC transport system permease protein